MLFFDFTHVMLLFFEATGVGAVVGVTDGVAVPTINVCLYRSEAA